MFETAQLIQYAQWSGIATIVCGAIAILAFLLKWGIRFRFVGITGFMAVLTGGIFALGLGLYTRPSIPNAVRYSSVFDTGAATVVIAVAPEINETQLTATLQQAASDLFSPGRLSQGSDQMLIRARTLLHPKPGVSQVVYLGEVQRSLAVREDDHATIKIYRDKLALLPKPSA